MIKIDISEGKDDPNCIIIDSFVVGKIADSTKCIARKDMFLHFQKTQFYSKQIAPMFKAEILINIILAYECKHMAVDLHDNLGSLLTEKIFNWIILALKV